MVWAASLWCPLLSPGLPISPRNRDWLLWQEPYADTLESRHKAEGLWAQHSSSQTTGQLLSSPYSWLHRAVNSK